MTPKAARARITCPYCGKKNVTILIRPRGRGQTGVTATIGRHGGLHADERHAFGRALDCSGVGRELPNKDVPPMSEWER